MALDDDLIKHKRRAPPGTNLLKWKRNIAQAVTRKKALEEGLFTVDFVIGLLNKEYVIGDDYINPRHYSHIGNLLKKGVARENIHKNTTSGVERIYLAEQGIMQLAQYFHTEGIGRKKRIGDYDKKQLMKELYQFVLDKKN